MNAWMSSNRIALGIMSGYVAYCLVLAMFLNLARGSIFGDWVHLAYYFWPYGLELSLQTWLSPGSAGSFALTCVFGALLVVPWSMYLNKATTIAARQWPAWIGISSVAWYPPLLLAQFIVFTIVLGLGLPVGE